MRKGVFKSWVGALLMSAMTVANAQIIQFFEDFESTPEGEVPAGWDLRDGGNLVDQTPPLNYDTTFTVVDADATLGHPGWDKILFIFGDAYPTTPDNYADTIITPAIVVDNAHTNLRLYYKQVLGRYSWMDRDSVFIYLDYFDNSSNSWVAFNDIVPPFDSALFFNDASYGSWTFPAYVYLDIYGFLVTTMSVPWANVDSIRLRFIFLGGGDASHYWGIDSVIVYQLHSGVDLRVTNVQVPDYLDNAVCPSASDSIFVTIFNYGYTNGSYTSSTPLDLVTTVINPDGSIQTIPSSHPSSGSLTIPSFNSVTVTVSGIDFTQPGLYKIVVSIDNADDDYNANNESDTFRFVIMDTVPQFYPFTLSSSTPWVDDIAQVHRGWREASASPSQLAPGVYGNLVWDVYVDNSSPLTGSAVLMYNESPASNGYSIVSPMLAVNPTQNYILSFDVATTGWSTPDAADSVIVAYSLDCGNTWQLLYVKTGSDVENLHDIQVAIPIPSTLLAGTDKIVFAFGYNDQTNSDYEAVYWDNIRFDTAMNDFALIDMQVQTPAGCPSLSDVLVVAKVVGGEPIDLSANPLTINLNVSGPISSSASATRNNGVYNHGDTIHVLISGVDMRPKGIYSLEAVASAAVEGNAANDTIRTFSLGTELPNTGLMQVDFNTWTGSPLDFYQTYGWTVNGSWGTTTWLGLPSHPNFNSAYTPTAWGSNSVSVLSSLYFPVPSGISTLQFSYDIGLRGTMVDTFDIDDTLFVAVSYNCGNTWTVLDQYDHTNTAGYQAGQHKDHVLNIPAGATHIQLAFVLVQGANTTPPGYPDVYIDNINLGYIDPAVVTAQSSVQYACPGSSVSFTVTLTDEGTLAMPYIPYTFNVDTNGASYYSVSDTVSMTLGVGGYVTLPFNFIMPDDTAEITFTVNAGADVDPSDNTITLTVYPAYADVVGVVPVQVLVNTPVTLSALGTAYGTVIDGYSWTFGTDATPATATGPGPHTVQWSTAGTKTVQVEATYCGGSQSVQRTYTVEVVQPTGLEDADMHALRVWTDGAGLLLAADVPMTEVRVEDIAGRTVYRQAVNTQQHRVAMATWAPGVYILQVRLADGTQVHHRIAVSR